ncbi:MAG: VOC family protein [Hyphomicrobiales bacterium]|nr:VOC family protein [Hyphomicrobiales bacterium]
MIEALDLIEVVTLFVEDLDGARSFYARIFGRPFVYEDEACAVMALGNLQINILRREQAPTLVAPNAVAAAGAGSRVLFTIRVDDVDAVCRELHSHGASVLNGPIDRPWGRRTAAFADPAGNVWEIAQALPKR